jgi:tetratricopeptide (TPR) repeat protein
LISCATNIQQKIDQSEAVRKVGEAYMTQGDYTNALRKLLAAEEIYSQDHILQDNLGLTYLAKEKPDLAIKHFKKALKIKKDYTPARNNLGTKGLYTRQEQSRNCLYGQAGMG